jgi:hypothetical protein
MVVPERNPVKLPHRSLLGLALVAGLFAGCGEDPPPPKKAPPPAAPVKPPPAIDAEIKADLDKDLAQARALIEEAKALKAKGQEAEKASKGSGKQNFSEAASKTTNAYNIMAQWCEATGQKLAQLNLEQKEYFIAPITAERQQWLMDAAQLGRMMKQ